MLKSEMGCITMKKLISIIVTFAICSLFTACDTVTDFSEETESPFEFEELKLVRTGIYDRVVFDDLNMLEDFVDIAVVGEFIADTEQEITYGYSDHFKKEIVTDIVSYNTIEVKKVLMGDVNVGDNLRIEQYYGIVDGELITYSGLTPMQKGDEWIFFLHKHYTADRYGCFGDTDARYPVPSAENAPMPLSDDPALGVYDEQDFNQDIYNEILEKYDI